MSFRGYKTKVYKFEGNWRVDYWLPYSGMLVADFNAWQDAMDDACNIEKQRGFI